MSTILIVEDEEMNRVLLTTILQAHGFSTTEADNGEDAVRMAKTSLPALILMDIQMPRMDGVEAARLLKADDSTRDIPLLAVTAFAMREDLERIQAGHFDGCVTKPVDIDDLIDLVQQHVKA